MSFLYSLGVAGWDEGEDMRFRFGEPWTSTATMSNLGDRDFYPGTSRTVR